MMLEDSVVRAVVSQLFEKWDLNRSYTLEGQELGGFFNEAFQMLRLMVPVHPEEYQTALKSCKGVASKEDLVNAIFFINTKRKAQQQMYMQQSMGSVPPMMNPMRPISPRQSGMHMTHSTTTHFGGGTTVIGTQVLPTIVPQHQMHTVSYVGAPVVHPGPPTGLTAMGHHGYPPNTGVYPVRPPSPQPMAGFSGNPSPYPPQFSGVYPGQVAGSQLQYGSMKVGGQGPLPSVNQRPLSPVHNGLIRRYSEPNSEPLEADIEVKLRNLVDQMFVRYDVDRSGSLDVGELVGAMNAMLAELEISTVLTHKEALDILNAIDVNHDNRVQKDELLNCLRNFYRNSGS